MSSKQTNKSSKSNPQASKGAKGKASSTTLTKKPYKTYGTPSTPIPTTVYGFNAGHSAQSKDLVVEATEFLDFKSTAEAPVLTYYFSDRQSFFQGGDLGNADTNVSKVHNVEVWALPRSVNASNESTSYVVLYETPAQSGLNQYDAPSEIVRQTSQRNTIVNPTFNVHWVKVGSTNFDKVFDGSQLIPLAEREGTLNAGICLFNMSIIDPDNKAIITGTGFQLMVKVKYSITLPVQTLVKVAVNYQPEFGARPTSISFTDEFCMNKLVSIKDTV